MNLRKITVLIASVLLVLSAGGCGRKESAKSFSPLYGTVPSDAVVVARWDSFDDLKESFSDMLGALNGLNLGRLQFSEVVVSYNYAATLVPMLSVNLGKGVTMDSELAREILMNSTLCGLKARLVTMGKNGVMIISPSESLLNESISHISAGTSILDAPGFTALITKIPPRKNSIAIRTQAATSLIKDYTLGQYIQKRRFVTFIKNISTWIGLSTLDNEAFGVDFSHDGSDSFFAKVIEHVNVGQCKLSGMLPENVEFVTCLSFKDWRLYRRVYEGFLDAQNKLKDIKAAKAWAEDAVVKEVARCSFDGRSVLLVRTRRKLSDYTPGYISSLFGQVFSIGDETAMRRLGQWTVIGSEEDVAAYLASAKIKNDNLPSESIFLVRTGKIFVYEDSRSCKLFMKQ